MLPILYESEQIVAINKPHGLLVHPSPIARDAVTSAMEQLRDQLGRYVYPVHRLDRKTSGVLLFAKSAAANTALQKLFREREMQKAYLAIVRGFVDDQGLIDYPLRHEGKEKEARTAYRCRARYEIALSDGRFPTSRYSFVEIYPETGRFHQIRKHFAHIFHPIIGDRPHGCNKQNRLWKERFGMTTMLLHAECLEFANVLIRARLSAEFAGVLELLERENLRS